MKLRVLVIGVIVCLAWPVAAQDPGSTCSALIDTALSLVNRVCTGTARNQACYGNPILQAEPRSDAPAFEFDTPGDRVGVADLASLRLGELDLDAQAWGIALMSLQANLPDVLPGQNATVLLFGDVRLRPVEVGPQLPAAIQADSPVNVRSRPSQSGAIVTQLAPGTALTARGRSESGDWLRVCLPEGGSGWVASFLVRSEVDLAALEVVTEESPAYRPMQAFYLQTGLGAPECQALPDSGVIIQTPEGAARVSLRINEVAVELGSTAYVHSDASGDLVVAVIEGEARLSAFDVTRTVPAGGQATIPLDDRGAAAGPPGPLEAYDPAQIERLPLDALESPPTEVVAPLTEAEIETLQVCTGVTLEGANLRSGGGQWWPVIGALPAGTSFQIVARADNGSPTPTYWQVAEGGWVIDDLVQPTGDCDNLPYILHEGALLEVNHCMRSTGPGSFAPNNFNMPISILVALSHSYPDEATAVAQYQNKQLTINGQPMAIDYGNPYFGTEGYWISASLVFWLPPAPGTYTLVGSGYQSHACTITIGP
jgi:uncharacterized protein YraI